MGYLRRHWRGELSLAVSFWVNFVLVNVLLGGAMVLTSNKTFSDDPVVLCRVTVILIGVQLAGVFPWQFVGLWRAGTHRAKRCGRHGLSVTLKLFLLFMLLFHVGETISRWDFYREMSKIAFLEDDMPACTFTLKANNTVLYLDGGLGFGVSKQFAEVLQQHPDIETVIVDCTGGRIYEARKMADLIVQRRLNTTTVNGCYSAGNLLFAAGENRSLCKGARLGFHEYYYPEPFREYADLQAEYRKDWGFYQLRGVTKDFQERMFSAEPNEFWYPTQQELLDGGMIHAVVDVTEILPMQEAILLGYDTSRATLRGAPTGGVTAEQVKGWILGCSSVLWERNRDDFVTLAGAEINPFAVQDKKKVLSEWWGIENRQELLKDLLWLAQEGGHCDGFAKDGRWASMMTEEELEEYLKPYESYAEKCNELRIARQYYESLGDKSILGWDLSRYLCLCRWGYLCGWLDEEEAWELMIPVARRLQETFDSWEDLGQNYLIGRQYWSLKHTQEDGELYEEAFDRLCEMPSSPWNRYPWDLDLSRAYQLAADPLAPTSAETKTAEPDSRRERKKNIPQVETMLGMDVIETQEPNGFVNTNRAGAMPLRFPADGAVAVNPDTHLVLTFDETPVLGTSGQVRIYDAADDRLVDVLDIHIPAGPTKPNKLKVPYTAVPYDYVSGHFTNANTKPGTPSGTALPTPDTYQLTIIGGFTDGFHFYPVIIHGNVATIYLHNNLLDYGKTYYVQIDPDVLTVRDGSFGGISGKTGWTFSTKKTRPAADSRRLVVSADGTGDFNTVQGAVDFVPDYSPQRMTIFIKNGDYEEIVYFRNKTNITFVGEDRDKVVVHYANNEVFNPHPSNVATNEWPGTFPSRRAAFMVDHSSDINLANMTIKTTAKGQAEGLLLAGERIIVSDVTIEGSGDALQANGSVYLKNCRITGDGDNILGRGAVFFDHCELLSTGGVYMWVRNTQANHGNVFVDCIFRTLNGRQTEIARAPVNNGRGYPYAEAVLINCRLEGISPVGWGPVGGDTSNVHYWEYHSTNLSDGTPVDVSGRSAVSRQLTMPEDAAIIADYSDPAYVLGGWKPDITTADGG